MSNYYLKFKGDSGGGGEVKECDKRRNRDNNSKEIDE